MIITMKNLVVSLRNKCLVTRAMNRGPYSRDRDVMDYSTIKLLHRLGHCVQAPSPFADPDKWAACAARIWAILRSPSMQAVWLRDRGLYMRAVKCAQYCENRSN